jgi:hypothetical protein
MRKQLCSFIIVLGLLPLASCARTSIVHAQIGFSDATLSGPYAFGFSGEENGGVPIAAVGRLTFDGNGGITAGNERRAEDGGVESVFSVTGSYSVNSDGTGTLRMNLGSGFLDTWVIAITSGGQTVKLVSIQPNTFAFGVVTGDLAKQ